MSKELEYEVIVIGGGHAGVEAALVCARLGLKTLLLTINLDHIAKASCNPAMGGLAKGHLIKEIDALGGEIAKVTDATGIQFRMLNKKKGPAVQAPRAQIDKWDYQNEMKKRVLTQKNLQVRQAIASKINVKNGKVTGVEILSGLSYKAKCVIVATGTFLRGLIYIGDFVYPAGRDSDFPSVHLSNSLKEIGIELGRLKTGTPARIARWSIDFSKMEIQPGDEPPPKFSFFTEKLELEQEPCYLTHTTEKTREIILKNVHRSPLYTGKIKGIGPRYCPSIEDKIIKFPDKERHHIFVEPEGRNSLEMYLNGLSTSYPEDLQIEIVRSVIGLEKAVILKPAYAIEYDFAYPNQIYPTLETRKIEGLFLAGQINGTSGYEEAAAQGIMAGINAAMKILGGKPFILQRWEAYIGVLIDDLITKIPTEPYRLFTSRAEYRLLLRHDNAHLRLMEKGYRLGLIPRWAYEKVCYLKKLIAEGIEKLKEIKITPRAQVIEKFKAWGIKPITKPTTLADILRRPDVHFKHIEELEPSLRELPEEAKKEIETEIKYEIYIKRQNQLAEETKLLSNIEIPPDFNYDDIKGLSREAREKLKKYRPMNLSQASRIDGVRHSDLVLLYTFLNERKDSA